MAKKLLSQQGGKEICGAKTRKCIHCKCDRRLHPKLDDVEGGPRGSCTKCGSKCPKFEPKLCEWTVLGSGGRCRLHGGKTPAGIASPHFITGHSVKSKYYTGMPKSIAAAYETALRDPQLLSLRHEIAVTKAYLQDAVAKVGDGRWVGPAVIKAEERAQKAWVQLKLAINGHGDVVRGEERMLDAMGQLRESCRKARQDLEARAEFRETVSTLEQLERSENARIVGLYNMISAERALALRQAETKIFMTAIEEVVTDRETRDAIRRRVAAGFTELVTRRNDQAVDPGSGPSLPDLDVTATED